MSVLYKERERERERDWETTSARSGGGGGGYTTVRRYKYPEHSLEEEDIYESEMKVVHRGGRSDYEERRSSKDYVSERDDKSVRQVREYRYVERSPSPRGRLERDVQEYRIQREYERDRSPSPSTVEEIRISRDYERERERDLPREQPYELERYSRSTEYFRPEPSPPQPIIIRNEAPHIPQAPQPIIIRDEPQPIIIRDEPQTIIIREREREPAYELIERTEVIEDRPVARPRRNDDFYYERKVKEVDRGGRHKDRYVEEREYDHDRFGDRDYYSDDDVVRIHKERDTWGGSDIHAKRDIAAGALAGVAAGQIVRHHRKRKGETPGGSVGNALGYGALGAVSAVALDKFNNRDRSRSLSSERGRGRREKSRHRSKSRVREIGALAAIAGVGALAYAAGRSRNRETVTVTDTHRHRSRSRRGRRRSKSVTVIETEGDRSRSRSKRRHSRHSNNKAAQVGLASAAVAGLVEHHRSKSRTREGKRPHSRVREGVPIAAAGVAGAAITGLYEKHKAKKEDRAISRSRSRSRSRSKSRSRSRSVLSRLTGRSRSRGGSTVSEPVLVEYGGDPIYTDPSTRRRSHRRHRRRSSSSSGRRHGSRSRSRSKSRTRSAAETAAVVGVAGLAAHEATKRRDRKKAEKERERERRREEDSAYSTGTYSPDISPQPANAYPNDSRHFPEGNYFPPPPTAPVDSHHGPQAACNPADYAYGAHQNYGPVPASDYVQPPPEDANLGNPYAPQYQQHNSHDYPQYRHDNVSAPVPTNSGNEQVAFASARGGSRPLAGHEDEHCANIKAENIDEPDAPSPILTREKTVQFDLDPEDKPSRKSSPGSQDGHDDRRHRRRSKDDRRHGRHDSPSSNASDETIELPSHFDERGRRRAHDPAADRLESLLQTLFR